MVGPSSRRRTAAAERRWIEPSAPAAPPPATAHPPAARSRPPAARSRAWSSTAPPPAAPRGSPPSGAAPADARRSGECPRPRSSRARAETAAPPAPPTPACTPPPPPSRAARRSMQTRSCTLLSDGALFAQPPPDTPATAPSTGCRAPPPPPPPGPAPHPPSPPHENRHACVPHSTRCFRLYTTRSPTRSSPTTSFFRDERRNETRDHHTRASAPFIFTARTQPSCTPRSVKHDRHAGLRFLYEKRAAIAQPAHVRRRVRAPPSGLAPVVSRCLVWHAEQSGRPSNERSPAIRRTNRLRRLPWSLACAKPRGAPRSSAAQASARRTCGVAGYRTNSRRRAPEEPSPEPAVIPPVPRARPAPPRPAPPRPAPFRPASPPCARPVPRAPLAGRSRRRGDSCDRGRTLPQPPSGSQPRGARGPLPAPGAIE